MMDQITVMGLDLSLTSTGVAKASGGLIADPPWIFRIRSAKRDWARLDSMLDRIWQAVTEIDPDVIVVEGPALHATGSHFHEGAGLWWLVTYRIWKSGRPMAVIPPSVLKKWATGRGNADKAAMCTAAAMRFGLELGSDEADALWLASAGRQHFGLPLVSMPAAQVAAIEGLSARKAVTVKWPQLRSRTFA